MQYPTSERAVRDIIRTFPTVLSRLSGDVRLVDIEQRSKTAKNYIIVYRSGGSADKYLNFDVPVLEIHCYGSTRNNSLMLAQALMEDMAATRNVTSGTSFLTEFDSPTLFWSPDGDLARYIVQVSTRLYSVVTGATGTTGGTGGTGA